MALSNIRRFDIYRYDFGDPTGSGAGYSRPVIVVQRDYFNDRLETTIVVPTSASDTQVKARHKSNVLLEDEIDLDQLSVAQIHLISHVDQSELVERLGELLCEENKEELEDRLSSVLDLPGWA